VIARKTWGAVHILDRFRIMAYLSKAIDEVRAQDVKELTEKSDEAVLTKTRWLLLKRPENLTDEHETKLADLLRYNLKESLIYLTNHRRVRRAHRK
jgi:transposase